MLTRFPIARIATLLCAAMIVSTLVSVARAQETSYSASFSNNKEAIPVNVLVGQSRVINFDDLHWPLLGSNLRLPKPSVAPDKSGPAKRAAGQLIDGAIGRKVWSSMCVRANLSLID